MFCLSHFYLAFCICFIRLLTTSNGYSVKPVSAYLYWQRVGGQMFAYTCLTWGCRRRGSRVHSHLRQSDLCCLTHKPHCTLVTLSQWGNKCMFGKRLHRWASFVPPYNFTLTLITVSNAVSWSFLKCFCPVRWGMNCSSIFFIYIYIYKSAICLPKTRCCRKALAEAGGETSTTVSTTRLAVATTTEHVPDVCELLCGTWKTTIETILPLRKKILCNTDFSTCSTLNTCSFGGKIPQWRSDVPVRRHWWSFQPLFHTEEEGLTGRRPPPL